MNPTVALPGSMIWMGIRLSSGSRRPQSPKGLPLHFTQSVFCSYGPVVVEWPEMLCAQSSQYPHRPIPPDQSRSVEVNGTGSVVVPAPAVLQGLSVHFVFSGDRARHSVWRLTSSSSATCTLLCSPRPQQCPRLLQIRFIEGLGSAATRSRRRAALRPAFTR